MADIQIQRNSFLLVASIHLSASSPSIILMCITATLQFLVINHSCIILLTSDLFNLDRQNVAKDNGEEALLGVCYLAIASF